MGGVTIFFSPILLILARVPTIVVQKRQKRQKPAKLHKKCTYSKSELDRNYKINKNKYLLNSEQVSPKYLT